MPFHGVQLGLGLISIGREWGYRKHPVPSAGEAHHFLGEAVAAGIRAFDTAPSYGYSEERFGAFLAGLDFGPANQLYIATKAGEHWDPATNSLHVDHSYDALARSIDRSLERLGRIDLLQIHKATTRIVTDPGVAKALNHAKASGIRHLGASITDVETAGLVAADDRFQAIQFPYHLNNRALEPVFDLARRSGKRVLVNRPFAQGEIAADNSESGNHHERLVQAFRCIVERTSDGIILTGTRSADHLRENLRAFAEAKKSIAA